MAIIGVMKRVNKIDFKQEELSSLLKRVRYAAKGVRRGEKSAVTSPRGMRPTYRKAFSICAKKSVKGLMLTGAEQWFSDNYFLIERALYEAEAKEYLPSAEGVVRVESVARALIEGSKGCLDRARVIKAVKAANSEEPLSLAEFKAFNRALKLATLEGLYALSLRIIHHEKMRKAAMLDDMVRESALSSDIYLYYAFRNKAISASLGRYTSATEMEIEAAFINSSLESQSLAEYLFKTLTTVNELANTSVLVEVSNTVETLRKHADFSVLSGETKMYYLDFVQKTAKRCKMTEKNVTDQLIQYSLLQSLSIGEIICRKSGDFIAYLGGGKMGKPDYAFRERLFVFAVAALSAAASFLLGWFYIGLFALLLPLPIAFSVEWLLLSVLSVTAKNGFIPRLTVENLSETTRTAVVVSHYITSEAEMKSAIKQLEVLKFGNKDKFIDVAMLVDFKAADDKTVPEDEELIKLLKPLKDRENFNVYIRARRKNGDKWSGRERKRGAIEDLNAMFASGDRSAFSLILNDFKPPKYVMLLDADSTLEPHAVADAVGIMEHPANKSYDLCALHAKYDLYSVNTPYSERFVDGGGMERYPQYSSVFYRLFRKDVFCGKGIYRVASYEKKLSGVFPENKILSHDVIEGAVLTTMAGGTVYEEAPSTFLEEESRLTRWQRGDIQLLPFICGRWKNNDKKPYRADFGTFYRFLMLKNAISPLADVMLFLLFACGIFLGAPLVITASAFFLLPVVWSLFVQCREFFAGKRFIYAFQAVSREFLRQVERFFLLPYRAVKGVYLLVGTLTNMAMKKNLLNWRTFLESRGENQGAQYVKMLTPSLIVITALLAGVFFVSIISFAVVAIYAVAMLLYWVALYLSGRKYEENGYSDSDKEYLREIARKTYAYFEFMRDKTALISDNYQLSPAIGKSTRTSPTNLGFEIVAEICACYCDLVGKDVALRNIKNNLDKIAKLKKWKGNLYNWYNVDGTVASSYISSVDSGNFVACLMTVIAFATEVGADEIAKQAKEMVENTELEAFYDRDKRLFHLGYDKNNRKFDGHYDLLASESRLLSLIYVAQSEDVAHWRTLSRDSSEFMGNTLLSWSGTMFEYLMPELFIPSAPRSLLWKSGRNAVTAQRMAALGGVWGRSESGEKRTDENGVYQYHAFGIKKLSLREEADGTTFAPYAAAMAVMHKKCGIKCLKNFEKKGASGEFGFYEAYDASQKNGVVSSHMTHHQGMIMCALCNVLTGGRLQKLNLNSAEFSAVKPLLSEKTSESVNMRKLLLNRRYLSKNRNEYFNNVDKIEYSNGVYALTDMRISIVFDENGNNKFVDKDLHLDVPEAAENELAGAVFYLKDKSGKFLPSVNRENEKRNVNVTQDVRAVTVSFIKQSSQITFIKNDCIGARYARLKIKGIPSQSPEVAFSENVMLTYTDSYISHPAYDSMKLKIKFSEEFNAVILERWDQSKKCNRYAAIAFKGLDISGRCFNKFKAYNGNRSEVNFDDFLCDDEEGHVLNPIVALKGSATDYSREESCYIVESAAFFAENSEELDKKLKIFRDSEKGFFDSAPSTNLFDSTLKASIVNALSSPIDKERLSRIFYRGQVAEYAALSGGKKTLFYKFGNSERHLSAVLDAVKIARAVGIDVTPVILVDNGVGIAESAVKRVLHSSFVYDYRILTVSDKEQEERFKSYAHVWIEGRDLLSFGAKPVKSYINELSRRENLFSRTENDENGFDRNGDYVLTTRAEVPYSNVIAGERGGFIATDNGGGYTFFGNSREFKATYFVPDPVCDLPSEYVYLDTGDDVARLNRGGSGGKTVYSRGSIEYYNDFGETESSVKLYSVCDGAVKVYRIELKGVGRGDVVFAWRPVIDWKEDKNSIFTRFSGDTAVSTNLKNGKSVFVRAVANCEHTVNFSQANERMPYIRCSVNGENPLVYVLIAADGRDITEKSAEEIQTECERSIDYFGALETVRINGGGYLRNLVKWLPYQTVSSRMNAKCGFYQVGGATGFRDQLQDAVNVAAIAPERLKRQILECASHQYEEGDVQHWWHTPTFGVRTRISDDKLFLPYAVGEYIRTTGDKEILDEEIPYLSSPVLSDAERDRVESPAVTEWREPLSKHVNRAFRSAFRFGSHGLLSMGSGDWNDGMDEIGAKMRGESVVTTLIAVWAIEAYAPFAPTKDRLSLTSIGKQLKDALNSTAWAGDRYARLFADDGRLMGVDGCKTLDIDLVSQALAVLSGTADGEKAKTALKTAEKLVDERFAVTKLLSPPQTPADPLGYISHYPKGARENGGQYTHAALWYIIALLKVGETEKAYELFTRIIPAWRMAQPELRDRYRGEPFVLSADIYSAKGREGQAGWTWYTGSAGWAYRVLTEGFLGLKRFGDWLEINPNLPAELDGLTVEYAVSGGKVTVKYSKRGKRRIVYDGVELSGDDRIPLVHGKEVLVLAEY